MPTKLVMSDPIIIEELGTPISYNINYGEVRHAVCIQADQEFHQGLTLPRLSHSEGKLLAERVMNAFNHTYGEGIDPATFSEMKEALRIAEALIAAYNVRFPKTKQLLVGYSNSEAIEIVSSTYKKYNQQ